MGADGGVAWLHCEDIKRFRELTLPWEYYIWTLKGSDFGERSRLEWLDKNPRINYKYHVIGGYGTDMSDVQLNDLPFFISYLEEALECPIRGLGPFASFNNLLLEKTTRPAGDYRFAFPYDFYGRSWIAELVEIRDYLNNYRKDAMATYEAVCAMRIKDWCSELRRAITGKEHGAFEVPTMETWT